MELRKGTARVHEGGQNVQGGLEKEERICTKGRRKGGTDRKAVPGTAILGAKAGRKTSNNNTIFT